ncbi:MAG: ATP synthase F1 subunit delta [Elusimicrobia bacterium GWC2_51_8]|nr:MAG: ATP synthase F1 subunit delta [Elusimicrobia bacterium GWA2_51_34]OGR61461.1 MAG: ATP synthase F1 subunit delta [Elusimicrobia bacterium GWC2_51_8]OGR85107.1 MAG: ATP synthase F1 subunit delta [Elusimicrobia bacterium GWF2_52_66]HAF94554.1 ATP synthase F1 subunit delta [Elusimicrobiota bacterium]HBO83472.1 ATP synthase F1 subunit delta [Deltaproteobacteria bacterium]
MKAADKTLAKRYARAYMGLDGLGFDHALESDAKARISALKKVFSAVEPYRKVLVHPVINGAVKEEILEKIMGASAAYGPARAFLEFLVKENRFFLFEEIVQEALRLFEAWRAVMKAEVYSRYGLNEAELKRLEKLLGKVSGKKMHLAQVITERVIGGFEIKMGGLLIDASVKGRFERLKKELFAI